MNTGARPELGSAEVTLTEQAPRESPALADAAFQTWTLPNGSPWTHFHRQDADYLLRFPGMADFTVSGDGTRVKAWPVPGTSTGTLHQLYLNQVLPLALSRQDRLVLHASAVEIDGQAVAFLAESGRGKSTLAASFATSGSPFLTDDGLQIEWTGDHPAAVPSHPSIRLWADSQQVFGGRELETAPSAAYTSKARFLAGAHFSFCSEARPLARVYLLGPGSTQAVSIEPTKPSDSLMAMVRNSFLLDITEREMLSRHFAEIARLANLPIHFHLDYPRRYEELPRVRAAIARHLQEAP